MSVISNDSGENSVRRVNIVPLDQFNDYFHGLTLKFFLFNIAGTVTYVSERLKLDGNNVRFVQIEDASDNIANILIQEDYSRLSGRILNCNDYVIIMNVRATELDKSGRELVFETLDSTRLLGKEDQVSEVLTGLKEYLILLGWKEKLIERNLDKEGMSSLAHSKQPGLAKSFWVGGTVTAVLSESYRFYVLDDKMRLSLTHMPQVSCQITVGSKLDISNVHFVKVPGLFSEGEERWLVACTRSFVKIDGPTSPDLPPLLELPSWILPLLQVWDVRWRIVHQLWHIEEALNKKFTPDVLSNQQCLNLIRLKPLNPFRAKLERRNFPREFFNADHASVCPVLQQEPATYMPTIKELLDHVSKMAHTSTIKGYGPRKWGLHTITSQELKGNCLLLGVFRSSKVTTHIKLCDMSGSVDCVIFSQDGSTERHDCRQCYLPETDLIAENTTMYEFPDLPGSLPQHSSQTSIPSRAGSSLGPVRQPSMVNPKEPLSFSCPLPQTWHMGCVVLIKTFRIVTEIFSQEAQGTQAAYKVSRQYLEADMRNVCLLKKCSHITMKFGNLVSLEPNSITHDAPASRNTGSCGRTRDVPVPQSSDTAHSTQTVKVDTSAGRVAARNQYQSNSTAVSVVNDVLLPVEKRHKFAADMKSLLVTATKNIETIAVKGTSAAPLVDGRSRAGLRGESGLFTAGARPRPVNLGTSSGLNTGITPLVTANTSCHLPLPCSVSQLIVLLHKDAPVRERFIRGKSNRILSFHLTCLYLGNTQVVPCVSCQPDAILPKKRKHDEDPVPSIGPFTQQSYVDRSFNQQASSGGRPIRQQAPPAGRTINQQAASGGRPQNQQGPSSGRPINQHPPAGGRPINQQALPGGGLSHQQAPPGGKLLTRQVILGLSGPNNYLYELLHPGCLYRLVIHNSKDLGAFLPPRTGMSEAQRKGCAISFDLQSTVEIIRVANKEAERSQTTAHKLHFLTDLERDLFAGASATINRHISEPIGIHQLLSTPRFNQIQAALIGRVAFKDLMEPSERLTSAYIGGINKENETLGVSTPYSSQVRVTLTDPDFSDDLCIYMKLEDMSYPLGLVPGAMVIMYGVDVRKSRQGNVYGTFTKASSVTILGVKRPKQAAKPGAKGTGDVGLINDQTGSTDPSLKSLRSLWFCKPTVFTNVCHVSKVIELTLTNQCPGCHQEVRGEVCASSRCPPNTATRVLWSISFLVEDSTGMAFTDTKKRAQVVFLLSLSSSQANTLEDMARKSVVISYNHKTDKFASTSVTSFLKILCSSTLVKRPVLLTAKKYRAFFNNKGEKVRDIAKMALEDFPEWEGSVGAESVTTRTFPWQKLECLNIRDVEPTNLIVKFSNVLKEQIKPDC